MWGAIVVGVLLPIIHAWGAIVDVVLIPIMHAWGAIVGVVLLQVNVGGGVVAHHGLFIIVSAVPRHCAHKTKRCV